MTSVSRLVNAFARLAFLVTILSQSQTVLHAQDLPAPGGAEDEFLREIISIKPIDVVNEDDALLKLQVAQHNVARAEVQEVYEKLREGDMTIHQLFDSGRRLLDAQLVLAESAEERMLVLEQARDFVQRFERKLESQLASGFGSKTGLARATYVRLEIEIALLEEQRRNQ